MQWILPENMGYILSHPETKDRVQSWSDASDVLRFAFTLTEDTTDHQYEEVLKATRQQLERELSLEDLNSIHDLPACNLLYK
ncbi:hypothetical protein ZEAMMB73_Zm00001d013017 [Zea mays]|uniref:Uncharacterized protein n=1 Tax=Zea mays TaxID=4577 RepID=A0A1D6GEX7_MAIZE|nr:hypothetical protein ZEAMMB73_Zm00001d013017 [Zea mays]